MSRIPESLRSGYGANNYSNGYNDSNRSLPGRVDEDEPPPDTGSVRAPSRPRDRRAGQYGGLQNPYSGFTPTTRGNALVEDAPQLERPTSLERTQAKRRSGNAS
jgi:exocyst complex component 4